MRTHSFAAFLLEALLATELDASTTHCFLAQSAISHQVLGECLDVETKLPVHFVFHTRAPESCLRPRTESAPESHTILQLAVSTLIYAIIRTSAPPSDRRAW